MTNTYIGFSIYCPGTGLDNACKKVGDNDHAWAANSDVSSSDEESTRIQQESTKRAVLEHVLLETRDSNSVMETPPNGLRNVRHFYQPSSGMVFRWLTKAARNFLEFKSQ